MTPTLGQRIWLRLYSLALALAFPLTLYHLVWRGLRQREYLLRWSERYTFFGRRLDLHGSIWVHAVSVGEVNAAQPLVEALLARYPQRRVLVTTITPTGSARARSLWGERVEHVYLPYDLRLLVRRFLDTARPALAIIVETEIWLNLYSECAQRGIPLMMVNARLSERSLRGYLVMRSLARLALGAVSWVSAQAEADAQRLIRIGADPAKVKVSGSLKFDLRLPAGLIEQAVERRAGWGASRPVWIAASTHGPEEDAIVQMHARVRARHPEALLLWAPRHPARFSAVAKAAREAGWQVAVRSADGLPTADAQAFVIDSLGELLSFYACADIAFVGGSLCDVGGHNVLEPAALGVPVLVGPQTFNFAEITAQLAEAGALRQLPDAESLAAELVTLLAAPERRAAMATAGREQVQRSAGALERTLGLVAQLLPGEAVIA
ncbi:MAG TPA: lipid IV(A) 3-deoxy-D-manno-octulosonic acid transferase [Arenimonas sp.]|nr:lipid IV(A) 3-deoxy-D-manno-octulosonic acid transferase [Arenimonas sp.]